MPIVIPSKNIFRKENQKVINNEITKISVEENSVDLKGRDYWNFSVSLLNEESANLLWIGYLKYTNPLSDLNIDGISYMGTTPLNNIPCAVFNIEITSTNYIHIPSIKVSLSLDYKRGESYEKTSSVRPALYSNDLLSDTQSVSVNDIELGEQKFVLSSFNSVPAVNCRLNLLNPSSQSVRSKRVVVQLFVPHYYNPVYSQRTNRRDSIVFTNCQISVYGEEFEFVPTKSSYGSGEATEEIYSNELFQKYDNENTLNGYGRGVYFSSSNGYVSAAQFLSEQIIGEYQNGKETATILCSISDYFTTDGGVYIDTKTNKMSFSIGDQVVPMVYGADKVDRPMSNYADGSAKVFRVVGLRFVYDGAVWQELTLQEV